MTTLIKKVTSVIDYNKIVSTLRNIKSTSHFISDTKEGSNGKLYITHFTFRGKEHTITWDEQWKTPELNLSIDKGNIIFDDPIRMLNDYILKDKVYPYFHEY